MQLLGVEEAAPSADLRSWLSLLQRLLGDPSTMVSWVGVAPDRVHWARPLLELKARTNRGRSSNLSIEIPVSASRLPRATADRAEGLASGSLCPVPLSRIRRG